jgi:UPF0755 protein
MKKYKYVIVFLFIVFSYMSFLVFYPVSIKNNQFSFRVRSGDSFSYLAKKLDQSGVIQHRTLFILLGKLSGLDRHLVSGGYSFQGRVSLWDILHRLWQGKPDLRYVTIREGATVQQIRHALASNEGLIQKIKDEGMWRDWLKSHNIPETPEGYFFPDTYAYVDGESDADILLMASKAMQKHLHEVWEHRMDGLPYKNPYELLIMASLVEKETGHPHDRDKVAGVFINRLRKGMRLQTDPTVIYGMGDRYPGRLTRKMLQEDTPFNTYTRSGLTPTPIAAPGLEALRAAAYPADTEALYFVARGDGTGSSQFSNSLDEHNQAVRRYIRKQP